MTLKAAAGSAKHEATPPGRRATIGLPRNILERLPDIDHATPLVCSEIYDKTGIAPDQSIECGQMLA
jgi:hypothetical protein